MEFLQNCNCFHSLWKYDVDVKLTNIGVLNTLLKFVNRIFLGFDLIKHFPRSICLTILIVNVTDK